MIEEKKIPWRINKEKTALLVIDMQNDFLKPGGVLYRSDLPMKVVPNIQKLIIKCRELKMPIIYIKTLLKDEYNISPLEACYHPHVDLTKMGMRHGTKGFEIIDELTPNPEDQIVIKHRYDAFYNTPLETVLRNIRGLNIVDTVIITGTLTNVCCETTARSAYMRDYKVVFASDGTGAIDEDAHGATLKNIEMFFGRVLNTDYIIKALESGEKDKIPKID